MKVDIEISEDDVRAAVAAEVSKRVRERLPYHSDQIRSAADTKIRDVVGEVLAGVDIRVLIQQKVQESLDKILTDTVRHQVKSVVRMAVHQELAAQKAEFQVQNSRTERFQGELDFKQDINPSGTRVVARLQGENSRVALHFVSYDPGAEHPWLRLYRGKQATAFVIIKEGVTDEGAEVLDG